MRNNSRWLFYFSSSVRMKTFLKVLLLITILSRVALFLLPSFEIDMNGWKAWSYRLAQVGPSNFYSPGYFSDYFPGYLYMLWIAGSVFNFLSIPINSLPFEIMLKSVTTIFDIGSAFYIYKITLKYNKKLSAYAPILYLLNPAVIFNTSIWGQIDGIFTFFILLSCFLLIENKNIFKSAAGTSLGVLVKPHALALIPVLFLFIFKSFPIQKVFKSVALGILILIVLSFPFFPRNPIFGLLELATRSQNVYQYTSLFAFNLWGIIGSWKPDNQVLVVSYKTWGVILYLLSLVLIFIPALRAKISSKQFYLFSALTLFSFFLFLTRMHERYLFPFLSFILIAAIINKSKAIFSVYVLGSILHFINLWFVYYYYSFVYANSKFADNLFYILVNNNFNFFCLTMLLLFGYLLILNFKYAKKT